MPELEDLAPIYALLLGVGIIFGTFQEFANEGNFGFDWFVQMLWFVVGFPVLVIVSLLLFDLAIKGEKKLLSKD